jgi:phosphate uptake regulator
VFLRLRKKTAMSHYEERLERDLSQIKQQLALLAGLVEKALDDAVHALLADDDKLAYATVLADNRINAVSNELDRMRNAFIGVHLPSGGTPAPDVGRRPYQCRSRAHRRLCGHHLP